MTVAFPKLPEGYRWNVTEPKYSLGAYSGNVQIQRNILGFWITIRSKWYFPNTSGIETGVRRGINDLYTDKMRPDYKRPKSDLFGTH